MADAKVCDRCGKFYLGNYRDNYELFERKVFEFRKVYKKFDLCNDCYEDFVNWIEEKNGN